MEYMLQGLTGFPVDYEMGRALQQHGQVRAEVLFNAVRNYVVKLVCKDTQGQVCAFLKTDSSRVDRLQCI